MIKVHSTVGLITNSSTVIFTENAAAGAADNIVRAIQQLLSLMDSDLMADDIVDIDRLKDEIEAKNGKLMCCEDHDIGPLISIMPWRAYRRDE